MQTADLGVIVTCVELGSLHLIDEGNYQPSDVELAAAAKLWALPGITFDDRDLSLIIGGMGLGNKLRKQARLTFSRMNKK